MRTVDGADFDELLREVLARVNGALDEQARLRLLLDAVVSMAADLTLDGVLARIVEISAQLTGAQYAALGVLNSGREEGTPHLRPPRHVARPGRARSATCRPGTGSWDS